MSRKKKDVAKMTEKVEPTYYATLTEEQYEAIDRISWNNPLDELKAIAQEGDVSMIEIGFKIGEVHRKFKELLDEIGNITSEIKPEEQDEFDLEEWDEEDAE